MVLRARRVESVVEVKVALSTSGKIELHHGSAGVAVIRTCSQHMREEEAELETRVY
jgi:hypothetical protein